MKIKTENGQIIKKNTKMHVLFVSLNNRDLGEKFVKTAIVSVLAD